MSRKEPSNGDTIDSSSEGIIEAFEASWQRGAADVYEHFEQHPARPMALLIELVAVDLEYRLKRGDRVSPEEHAGRFPDLAADPIAMSILRRVSLRRTTQDARARSAGSHPLPTSTRRSAGIG
jgi:hypothetical protein